VGDTTSSAGCSFFTTEVSPKLSNETEGKEGVELTMTDADKKALDTDYAEGEVSREEAKRYPLVQRGSVRLVMDLYRTESEQREFIDEGVRLRLPGQKGYRRKHVGLVELLRSLFTKSKVPHRGE
jgi:hypothetical protein